MAQRVLDIPTRLGRLRRGWVALRERIAPDATSGADQWQRVILNREVDRYLLSLDPASQSAVEISGGAHAAKGWKQYAALNYPEFDLCAPLEGRGSYDVVICEQVLEHVVDPCAAAANLRRLCRPGGHVVVSTPFLVKVHELPDWGLYDYWRFTPRGLRTLLEQAGLDVETVHTWGNRRAVRGNFDRWPAFRRWHSLRDESELPLQVWAFARNRAPDSVTGR